MLKLATLLFVGTAAASCAEFELREPAGEDLQSEAAMSRKVVCRKNGDCEGPNQFCRLIGCGAGTCAVRPQECTENHAPVCSCTNVTYSNDCFAARSGESVARAQACP